MRRRVLLTVLSVGALAVLLFLVPMALIVRDLYQQTDQLELQRLAAIAARQAPSDLAAATTWTARDGDTQHRYALYEPAGRRLAGDGPDTADPTVRHAFAQDTAQGQTAREIVAAIAFGPDGRTIGVLRVAEPREESTRRITNAIWQLIALAGAALAVASLAARWLVRRLLRPVEQLRRAAAQLGEGDFTITAPHAGLAELDHVAAALNSSSRRIGQLVDRERTFSADASHQLRTPLAAATVALETELLSPRADPSQALRESLHALLALERTIDELLQLARDTHTDRDPVDTTALLARAHHRWQKPMQTVGRKLVIQHDPWPTTAQQARASQAALDHILDVLIDNALRHGMGTVALRAEYRPGDLIVSVSDQGPSPADPTALFRRRNTTANGTGIGLAMARALAEAENARLNLAAGDVTRFEIALATTPAAPRTTVPKPA